MIGWRTALPLGAAFFCAVTAFFVVPRGFEAQSLLLAQDDPGLLADHALDRSFDAAAADREIRSALAANDLDLANSFRDLARERDVLVDPALAARVETANSRTATAMRAAGTFGRGLLTGEPDDLVGLAGTALGDLFVFGDIRDAVREGSRLARGEHADEMVLGLAGLGIAVTAGTYASLGAGTPARIGLSLTKAARKTGRMTARMGAWVGHSLREVVDWTALRRTVGGASLTEPVVAVRAAREAVKLEKSEELARMLGDIGRVQRKAGTGAALDGLKIAEGPRDVSRIARLAESRGTGTRAILRLFGRGAIWLMAGAFNLFSWVLGAVLTLFGFCSACKSAAERATELYLARRKRRKRILVSHFAALPAHA
jgi:hypothetical protein